MEARKTRESASKLCVHRGKVKNGSSVWARARHLEALPAGKPVLTQTESPKKSLLGLRALENLQVISRWRGGVPNAQGSESQGPLTGGGQAPQPSSPALHGAPGWGNASQVGPWPSCDPCPRSPLLEPRPSIPQALGPALRLSSIQAAEGAPSLTMGVVSVRMTMAQVALGPAEWNQRPSGEPSCPHSS